MKEVKEPAATYDKVYTYSDYLKFDFDYMVELIRGKIFKMTPAPSMRHQRISRNLQFQIELKIRNGACELFTAPTDVVLPIENRVNGKEHTVVQPDICIFCDLSILKEQAAFGPPTLVVEILSPHTRKKDIQLKYDIYEEAGVQEYWVIMPREELLEQFVLMDGKYQRIQTYTKEDSVAAHAVPGLIVALNEVFVE
jgi:Uma2 family endonuclease